MASLDLKSPPYPMGDTDDGIRKDPKLCRVCWNLYPGSASSALPLAGIAMHENAGTRNSLKAAKAGNLEKAPTWAGQGRIDYTSWEIKVYLPDVPGSAMEGCVSCSLLQDILTKLNKGKLDCSDPELWLEMVFCKGNVLRARLVRGSPPEDDFDMFSSGGDSSEGVLLETYEIYTLPGSPCPWPTIGSCMNLERPDWSLDAEIGGHAGHIEPDPTSRSSFDRARHWIQTCKEKHTICSEAEAASKPRLPKRVVDIGPETNDGIHIFVHDDSKEQITEPYIALSHCWGRTQHLKSEKATLEQWKRNIPFTRFAKTFQDAIVISRELGIRYVWIDSLCIVQDDSKDWEIEAAKMASIYNGAELVLSATGSVDGSGGCLFPREPYVTVSGTYSDGKPFDIYGRKISQHSAFGWNTDRNVAKGSSNPITGTRVSDIQDHPLLTRAWCFQERLLATRILHYTKSEMIFDCLSAMDCECGALEKHEDDPLVPARRIIKTGHKYITGTKSYRGSSFRPSKPLQGETKEFQEHHELWRDLIVQYSQKNITFRTDGLPAVAGLATEWSGKMTKRYLAGLWEGDLLNSLRWMPDEKDSGLELKYIAPSWSWLSVHRGVTWGLHSFEYDKFFVNVDFNRTTCIVKGENQFGKVKSGYIFVTGRAMPMTFTLDGDNAWLEKQGSSIRKPFERPDSLFRLRNLKTKDLLCLRLCTSYTTRNAWDDDCALVLVKADEEELNKPDEEELSKLDDEEKKKAIKDGLLQPRLPQEVREFGNVYQRVGYITNYLVGGWNHERDSTEMEMYII
ncbi:heterokaryon incompatibility protein-domain-containing protein [Fusarium flagelliforme]|uniref:Heterokaryon incompatibility domain-containing protein n=1 Tax=Fusarium flagelliforme TaxID=2675880 RepID=A0A395MQX9_9HYPO|nr:heterokaryon incompatibility protein-domain-containing protein [Fusarium flagelliforme]KAH7198515.1 heterokaryon incompatibility protein-domain-containing protein [Fusarium flagelliforme]RFN49965.1 hypothetical protein FIE12Z_5763 [Fusarium flagelliforme]